jgi:propanediol dehydratase small subunit
MTLKKTRSKGAPGWVKNKTQTTLTTIASKMVSTAQVTPEKMRCQVPACKCPQKEQLDNQGVRGNTAAHREAEVVPMNMKAILSNCWKQLGRRNY